MRIKPLPRGFQRVLGQRREIFVPRLPRGEGRERRISSPVAAPWVGAAFAGPDHAAKPRLGWAGGKGRAAFGSDFVTITQGKLADSRLFPPWDVADPVSRSWQGQSCRSQLSPCCQGFFWVPATPRGWEFTAKVESLQIPTGQSSTQGSWGSNPLFPEESRAGLSQSRFPQRTAVSQDFGEPCRAPGAPHRVKATSTPSPHPG